MNQHIDPAALGGLPAAMLGHKSLLALNPVLGPQKTGPRRFWTKPEQTILRALYPEGGIAACLPKLPGRTATSIACQAKALRLGRIKLDGQPAKQRQIWTTSPAIDAAIVRSYENSPTRGHIKSVSLSLGRPAYWVRKRALELGCELPRFKEPNWTDAELDLLRANPDKDEFALKRMLKARGFSRTVTAIAGRIRRLHIARETPDGVYSASTLAQALGCGQAAVRRYIEKGWLIAARKPLGIATRGGEEKDRPWLIREKHVRAFIIDNVGLLDFRKVDKHWLVDIVAGARR